MERDWRKGSLTWGKRLVLVVLILAGAVYAMFSMAQRSPEALRKGLEDYLVNATGHYAEITQLSQAKLAPDILFNMQGISIRDRGDLDKTYLYAEAAVIHVPLWRMMFGNISTFRAAEVRGLQAATGFPLPQKLTLDFAGITDPAPETSPAQFILDGEYNNRPLLATIEMQRKPDRKGALYSFASSSLASFKLGDTEMQGLIVRGLLDVTLDAGELRSGGVKATFKATGLSKRPLNINITGDVGGAGFNAVLTANGDNALLKITPDTAVDEAGLQAIKRLVDSVSGDMGLTGKDSILRISIADLETPPDENPKDSNQQ